MRALVPIAAGCAGSFADGPRAWDDPVPHDGDDWLFAPDRVSRIDLQVGPDAERVLRSERLLSDPRDEVRATAVIDGEDAGAVGLRLRGGSGSFQRWDEKPKLALDFRAWDDERFHGLERLALNNAKMDCSALGESLAAAAFAEAGVPASRTGYAQLFVNGADHGVYVVVETQDDRFLDRAFDDDEANLYDGSYLWAGWLPYFLDFGRGRDHRYDLEEGTDVGFADLALVSDAVVASLDAGRVGPALRDAVDWDEVHRYVAVDQWLGTEDGYPTNRNNVSVVFPTDGPMALAPWDLDTTFRERDAARWAEDAKGRLWLACVGDPACVADHAAVVREVADALDAVDWSAEVSVRTAAIGRGVDGDPRRRCSDDELAERRADVDGWFDHASERLRDAW